MIPQVRSFLESVNRELSSKSNQVRDLIGSSHWGHDGAHKERLLRNVIQRSLPNDALIGQGFIVGGTTNSLVSREQDIIVVDNSHSAPLINEGGLIITDNDNVIGTLSVKTKMGRKEIRDTVETLLTARESSSLDDRGGKIWCGGFFYEYHPQLKDPKKIKNAIEETMRATATTGTGLHAKLAKRGPDVICCGEGLLFLLSYGPENYDPSKGQYGKVRMFQCGELATAGMIASLQQATAWIQGKPEPKIAQRFLDYIG